MAYLQHPALLRVEDADGGRSHEGRHLMKTKIPFNKLSDATVRCAKLDLYCNTRLSPPTHQCHEDHDRTDAPQQAQATEKKSYIVRNLIRAPTRGRTACQRRVYYLHSYAYQICWYEHLQDLDVDDLGLQA